MHGISFSFRLASRRRGSATIAAPSPAQDEQSRSAIRCLPFETSWPFFGVAVGDDQGLADAWGLDERDLILGLSPLASDPLVKPQGNVAHLADVSEALQHSPDSNGLLEG